MVKKKTESFLSRKGILTKKQYEEYKKYKKDIQKRKYQEENKFLKQKVFSEQRQEKYNNSIRGKISNATTKFAVLARNGATRALYNRNAVSRTASVRGLKGTRGRPYGSVKYVDPRTGQPIGVYEYRKLISLERQRLLASRNISPAQAQVLEGIRQREYQKKLNSEARIIPSTEGDVYLDGIMNEIDRASNAVA